jgi:hypothetical protein
MMAALSSGKTKAGRASNSGFAKRKPCIKLMPQARRASNRVPDAMAHVYNAHVEAIGALRLPTLPRTGSYPPGR